MVNIFLLFARLKKGEIMKTTQVGSQYTQATQGATEIREASNHLSTLTPSEAANYAINYMKIRIKDSVNLEILNNGQSSEATRAQQIDMHNRAGVYGTPVNRYTSNDFINLTREAKRCSIGNCADVCMVAAHSLVDNGYPHPIELCAVDGNVEGFELDHAFLVIHGDPEDPSVESHIVDPFLQMLSEPEQHNFFGRSLPVSYEQSSFNEHFFCYAAKQKTGEATQETIEAKFVPVSDIRDADIVPCGKIYLDSNNKPQFATVPRDSDRLSPSGNKLLKVN